MKLDYELGCYALGYALIIVLVWAYFVHKENKLVHREMANLRKACNDLKVFAHTMSYRK